MEKTNFLFNDVSGAHKSRLSEADRATLETMEKAHDAQRKALDADHEANKGQRIAEAEKRLQDHQKAQMDAPRPRGAVVHLKSSAEIASEARSAVKRAYQERRQAMFDEGRKAERDFVKKALGIPDQSAFARTIGHKTDLDLSR